jgi:hypothetical protein
MKSLLSATPILLCIALAGCVTDSESFLPDGSKGHLVTCGGALFAYSDCIKHAGDICGDQGYQILGVDGNATPYATSNGGFSATPYSANGGFNSSAGMITNRSVMVKCGTTTKAKKSGSTKNNADHR